MIDVSPSARPLTITCCGVMISTSATFGLATATRFASFAKSTMIDLPVNTRMMFGAPPLAPRAISEPPAGGFSVTEGCMATPPRVAPCLPAATTTGSLLVAAGADLETLDELLLVDTAADLAATLFVVLAATTGAGLGAGFASAFGSGDEVALGVTEMRERQLRVALDSVDAGVLEGLVADFELSLVVLAAATLFLATGLSGVTLAATADLEMLALFDVTLETELGAAVAFTAGFGAGAAFTTG